MVNLPNSFHNEHSILFLVVIPVVCGYSIDPLPVNTISGRKNLWGYRTNSCARVAHNNRTMNREEKIKLLEDISAGRVNIRKTPQFILPCNDGSSNFIVITQYGTKVITKQQFESLKFGSNQ